MDIFETGTMIISLDFEMGWGNLDKQNWDRCRKKFEKAMIVIPNILDLFRNYDIHATWATVGMVLFKGLSEARTYLKETYPCYEDPDLSLENAIRKVAENESLFFAPDLVKQITSCPGQEIATHTFTHFYCMEKGQDLEDFKKDLGHAIKNAQKRGIHYKSIVFPRDQLKREYLQVCREKGLIAFRGPINSWIYSPRPKREETLSRRGVRLLDSYIPISGNHTYGPENIDTDISPMNISTSMFLRPYSRKLAFLEPLKIQRVKNALKSAAFNKKIFHFYWHPYNFSGDTEKNMDRLRSILDEFSALKKNSGIKSLNIHEVASSLINRPSGGSKS